jgi:hypothetical protein
MSKCGHLKTNLCDEIIRLHVTNPQEQLINTHRVLYISVMPLLAIVEHHS